jgi:hypothetical protein
MCGFFPAALWTGERPASRRVPYDCADIVIVLAGDNIKVSGKALVLGASTVAFMVHGDTFLTPHDATRA